MNKVLFLCTHNSARSQMAEGLLRHRGGADYAVYSAGTEKTLVRPQAVEVMKEIGIDISGHTSKTLDEYIHNEFDEVITVCDKANESCPVFPNAKNTRHWNFPDPSRAAGSKSEVLFAYREVRDVIRKKIQEELLSI
ncbi:protein-tyrosine-phosphatase [Candidatus Gottesmanbacteria bacterium RIFCSPLOWO2_01_FULL_46_9]|uniref:Protein-tyrosine-phosphatase n=1 Tax=Candidatus Gottesmanbacteria bacterium RIFCSPLOWO2_01_FULL_46_9 TaxID=1798394 RepID=A0A1F6B416_9BACT|nr:MAG: protein-tyrosine-phosphatase [Candidatus Gottesmanbacteria bacterium RIFCSPLOWO2_01_FULL_46_9]